MPVPGYSAWSVTAGEQPTTAYWNILGSNDAAFNTMLSGPNTINGNVLENNTVTSTQIEVQEAWQTPTLTNGTVTTTVGYMKDSLGFVHLRGQVNLSTNVAIFTLPAGYVPGNYKEFASSSGGTFCVISISTGGIVSRAAGSAGNTDLDCIVFEAGG